jgi:putative DNA primase/helicase
MEPVMTDRRLTPEAIPLSQEAMGAWIETHDTIERQLAEGGNYIHVRDFGSKAAENVARLAAVFQIVEPGPIVSVSEENIRRASAVVEWHMAEAKRCFSGAAISSDPIEKDARELLEWMIARAMATGLNTVPTSEIGHNGPKRLRLKEKRSPAIDALIERACIRKIPDRSAYEINPRLLSRERSND